MLRITQILASAALAAATFTGGPVLAGEVFIRPEPAKGFSYPDYFCTNRGVRVEVEEVSCLNVDGREILAKCDISLNNPMWRPTGETCDSAITTELSPGNTN